MKSLQIGLILVVLLPGLVAQNAAWHGFRGPNAAGVAGHAQPPLEWGDAKNVLWRTRIPGAGSSSPIVAGDRVFVTCYAGYGMDPDDPGHLDNLRRAVVCFDRKTGNILWQGTVPATVKEQPYSNQVTTHGYASQTPVTDGKNVYAFFGRTGVAAFDENGKQIWLSSVGDGKTPPRERPGGGDRQGGGRQGGRGGRRGGFGGGGMIWGSAASLLLAGDMVIINAWDASITIRALDKRTGKEVWKRESQKIRQAAASPILVDHDGDQTVILALASEVWGLDPKTGKDKWKIETGGRGAPYATPTSGAGTAFVFGGMRGGGYAIRCSGEGKPGEVIWKTRQNAGIPSPVYYDGKIFLVGSRGLAEIIDAKSGEAIVSRNRLDGRPGSIYASPVVAGGRLYVVSRTRGTFVYSADKELKLLATNTFEQDKGEFNGSPAFADNQIILRSDNYLYCLQQDAKRIAARITKPDAEVGSWLALLMTKFDVKDATVRQSVERAIQGVGLPTRCTTSTLRASRNWARMST